ncbi:hypothetical protein [Maritimibacter sp. DP1N21-5]|uniref:Rz1-like lysis system protein LysC n=1 Tax=Maritimibacter sp. DP1N21-5 TaxID=2836867 RepID=UPI001C468EA5|nr:hypothetical protein [Maritimibacter sp. DP1N21-5]MBV7408783.1 hypothetical protein [Maritimibacter sp. DP1N21-5]
MAGLFLTACGEVPPVTQPIPDELLRPEIVTCPPGDTVRALGSCAIALRRGLDTANDKLTSIAEIVSDD